VFALLYESLDHYLFIVKAKIVCRTSCDSTSAKKNSGGPEHSVVE